MSAWDDFIKDFPDRCNRILDTFDRLATENDLEVTLLLSVIATGLIVPEERLQGKSGTGDSKRYVKATAQFKEFLDYKVFVGSDLNPGSGALSWKYSKTVHSSDVETKQVESWLTQSSPKRFTTEKVGLVVLTLRHALAHGNVFTQSSDPIKRQITELVFYNRDKTTAIVVAPVDLKQFAKGWFSFTQKLDITRNF